MSNFTFRDNREADRAFCITVPCIDHERELHSNSDAKRPMSI